MSIKLYYQPLVESVEVEGATDNILTTLQDTFGKIPIILDDEHLSTLRVLAVAAAGLDPNPYEIIIKGIVECGKIRLYFRSQPLQEES